MDVKEKILEFIKQKGPILPVQIAKEINSDILMASAHLSELKANKQIKISNLKIGGSPLYYLQGQETRLQEFTSNLHEKEKRIYDLLSQKKILRDNNLDPVMRVAIRAIKDFAIPLQVNYKDSKEIFWKWYLLPSVEAEGSIKEQIKALKPVIKKEIPKKIEKPIKKETLSIFFNEITNYFNKNKINIISQNIIRKNSEINFVIELSSAVGNLRYFCIAKSKKKINDGDLSSAYIKAQSKKLPVLFLTKGELTKKAKEILEKEFKGMNIKKI